MGDAGDYWRESRDRRRRYRATLVECLCGRSVDPLRPCPDCDRIDDPEASIERDRKRREEAAIHG